MILTEGSDEAKGVHGRTAETDPTDGCRFQMAAGRPDGPNGSLRSQKFKFKLTEDHVLGDRLKHAQMCTRRTPDNGL